MITVSIFAKKDYVSQDGQVPIMLRLTIHRQVFPPIKLNKRTRLQDWDDAHSRVKDSHPNAYLLNKFLDKVQAKGDNVLLQHELTGRVITHETFVREFNDLSPYDFYYLADKYKATQKSLAWSYRQKTIAVVKKLKSYRPMLELHQVNYEFVLQYVEHLRTEKKNVQNTINTNMKVFRRIFRLGMKMKLVNENPFLEYRLPTVKPDREALTFEEVKLYQDLYKFKQPYYLRNILTWFLLAVHTGRRFGDLQDFPNWSFSKEHIKIHQMKKVAGRETRKIILIYMNDAITTLLALIRTHNYKLPSNQKANDYLEELTKLTGITKHITFHCARHTFASINKKLTEDLTIRRDLLGHDSIKSTLVYEHTDPEQLKETMLKWNSL